MIIRAYQSRYVANAQSVLGEAFDYAINTCNINGNDFVKEFITSSISKKIEKGEAKYITGKSGIELVVETIEETTGEELSIEPAIQYGRSKEYWVGWAIAYYQWYSNKKFREIFNIVSFDDLQKMYYTMHETDISKFVDVLEELFNEKQKETNLRRIRKVYGCTQLELAKMSGVSLRSIQMYEQRKKNINRASVERVYALAKTLGCEIEDLLEATNK